MIMRFVKRLKAKGQSKSKICLNSNVALSKKWGGIFKFAFKLALYGKKHAKNRLKSSFKA